MYSLTNVNGMAVYEDRTEEVCIRVPAACCQGMAAMRPMPTIEDEDYFRRCVFFPISGSSLRTLAESRCARSACILVSDATRLSPTSRFVPYLVEELVAGGVPMEGILFVVAIGVHRDATKEEMRAMVGEALWGRVRIINHTPFDRENLLLLGTTSFGTPVEVNKEAYACDLHIAVGKVEPHEFAGFSGGRKSVLPGICSERTISRNHSPEMLFSKNALPGILEGNPVHQDMLESARMFRIDFCINAVLNEQNQPAAAFAGDVEEAHRAAVLFLKDYAQVAIAKPDIIVTTPGAPLNIDFYQSMKTLIALAGVLSQDTVVALYCECVEGVNSEDMMRPFRETRSLAEAVEYMMDHYKIQMDHALLISRILKKGVKIVVYSPHVSEEDIAAMHMVPAADYEDMMEKAWALTSKKQPRIVFYPQAQRGLPILLEE